ncbi:hypothetical protein MLD38_002815 [Melastoma candidum]|uniref:Uncharacterized protein n=1 Tax=Melastoma candidum TaxID=119954 RepID=A0ACB9S3N5_9MYRT|nr:hypothetical protein MLD38_002815 [Melastoma candidum]
MVLCIVQELFPRAMASAANTVQVYNATTGVCARVRRCPPFAEAHGVRNGVAVDKGMGWDSAISPRHSVQDVNSLTILVMGKSGVGKSSTVNSVVGERAVVVSPFQVSLALPFVFRGGRARGLWSFRAPALGFTLTVINTPGLIEGGYLNDQTLEIIKRFLLEKRIDVLMYVDRLDAYRVDNMDKQIISSAHTRQLSPPDGLEYDVFFSRRSESLLKVVRAGAKLKKQDAWGLDIPFVQVENSGRCNKNQSDEKILPNGTAWIPNPVKTIVEVVLNGSNSILVDRKLIEEPTPSGSGKSSFR